jgi:hypothetical protein
MLADRSGSRPPRQAHDTRENVTPNRVRQQTSTAPSGIRCQIDENRAESRVAKFKAGKQSILNDNVYIL